MVENEQAKQKLAQEKQTHILNVAPAVIHSTGSNRTNLMLSQRAKTELREVKQNKVIRCKTVNFDWSSQANSLSLKETTNSYNQSSRPKTATENLAGLNRIKVYLPSHTQSTKIKDE